MKFNDGIRHIMPIHEWDGQTYPVKFATGEIRIAIDTCTGKQTFQQKWCVFDYVPADDLSVRTFEWQDIPFVRM